MKLFLKVVLPLIILGVGAAGFAYLLNTKDVEKPAVVEERVWNVAAETVNLESLAPELTVFGTLIASRDVELRSLVAGEIIHVGENFKEGALLEKGDLLIEVDPFNFEAGLAEKKASLLEAEARLVELKATERSDRASLARDKEILELDIRNVTRSEKLSEKGNISEKALDNALSSLSRQRQQVEQRKAQLEIQRARIGQQNAVIARLKVGVERAERDLVNTKLTAPFKGYISEIGAELGKRIDAKDKVARLIDASEIEVQFHLSDWQYGILLSSKDGVVGRSIKVNWQTGKTIHVFDGKIARIGSKIKAETGGIEIYAVLKSGSRTSEARPGAFVDVVLTGEQYPNAVRIPEHAVYEQNKVYVIEEGRLSEREVQILYNAGSELLITGKLLDGDQLVTTRFAEIGSGLRVEVRK